MDGLIQVDGSDPVTSVLYEYAAEVRDGGTWVPLPVVGIAPSASLDRVPYAGATVTAGPLTAHQWALLDPRTVNPARGGNVRWQIRQVDPSGATLGHLPPQGGWATMYARTVQRSLNTTTITVSGAETMIDDRLVLEGAGRLTSTYEVSTALAAATSLGEYVDAILRLTFGTGHAEPADDASATALNLGNRHRLDPYQAPTIPYADLPAQSGSTFMQLIETELSSVGCRLIDTWGHGWKVSDRNHAPDVPTLRWATHEDVPAGVAPIIVAFDETISRDGDWADTIVVIGEAGDIDETRSWRHTADTGTSSRGLIIEMKTPEPSGNLAASIASRAFRRGHDITIRARIVLDVTPGAPVEIHLLSGILTGEIVSVDWDTEAGEMTVHARSATTTTVDRETRAEGAFVSADRALAEARLLAADATTQAQAAAQATIHANTQEQRQAAARGYDGSF